MHIDFKIWIYNTLYIYDTHMCKLRNRIIEQSIIINQ